MNTPFDWNLVRSFLAVLEHGSLLGAARALQSSQPTMGRHIAELETQLGTVLFERTGRGLQPTATALRLAESARAMEAGAHALARGVSGAQAGASGTVRISASQPVACLLLPPLLLRMRQQLPDIQVELVASNEIFFAATGVTDGSLLSGVKRLKGGVMTTESVVMRASSGTVRWVRGEHRKG